VATADWEQNAENDESFVDWRDPHFGRTHEAVGVKRPATVPDKILSGKI
jgi:hypothetical protein